MDSELNFISEIVEHMENGTCMKWIAATPENSE